MNKDYTAQELVKKFKGKYIRVMQTFDYASKQWLYRVYKTSRVIRENFNLPEDCLIK